MRHVALRELLIQQELGEGKVRVVQFGGRANPGDVGRCCRRRLAGKLSVLNLDLQFEMACTRSQTDVSVWSGGRVSDRCDPVCLECCVLAPVRDLSARDAQSLLAMTRVWSSSLFVLVSLYLLQLNEVSGDVAPSLTVLTIHVWINNALRIHHTTCFLHNGQATESTDRRA